MIRRMFLIGGVLLCVLTGLASRGLAAEKLRYGLVKVPTYILPVLAAEEKGFWKQNGLEAKWTGFWSPRDIYSAIAAGALDMAGDTMADMLLAAVGRTRNVTVAVTHQSEYLLWVRSDSPILKPEHLKGGKLGVSRLGGLFNMFLSVATRKLGLEKDVKIVSAGGHGGFLGLIKTGKIQGVLLTAGDGIALQLKGELRPLFSMNEFLPKKWIDGTISASRPLINKNPGLVRKAVRSVLQSKNFVRRNKPWAVKQMVEVFKFGPREAEAMVIAMLGHFDVDQKISRKAVENVRNLLIENKLVDKKRVPPVDELFTNRFVE